VLCAEPHQHLSVALKTRRAACGLTTALAFPKNIIIHENPVVPPRLCPRIRHIQLCNVVLPQKSSKS